MSIIESFLKAKMKGTLYEDFEPMWSVGFCQGDFINIYGCWGEEEFAKVIESEKINPVVAQYVKRFLDSVEVDFESERRHLGGSQEEMSFSEYDVEDLVAYWYEDFDEEQVENAIPAIAVETVAQIVKDMHDDFVIGLNDFCSDALSQAHDILLNCPSGVEELFRKSFGGAEVIVSQDFSEHASDVFDHGEELTMDDFAPLLNDEAKIIDIKVEISFNGISDTYWLTAYYGSEEHIFKDARNFARESIGEFRASYLARPLTVAA